jgi:hypothetical protein
MKWKYFIVFIIAIPVGMGILGCDSTDSLGDLFNALEGKYRVRQGSDCFIQISGSEVTSVDGSGHSECVEVTSDEYGDTMTESLTAAGTLSDKKVEGVLTLSEHYVSIYGACRWEEQCTYTFDGKSLKQSGADVAGKFSSLAGEWTSNIDFRRECTWSVNHADSTNSCLETTDPEGEYISKKILSTATVSGNLMDIKYHNQNRDNIRQFYIELLADDSLYVGHKRIEYE